MNILRLAPLIIQWAPFVYSAVVLVEQIVGPGRSGYEKKEMVLAWLSKQAKTYNLPWGHTALAAIDDTIDASVGVMNLLGYFRGADEYDKQALESASQEAAATQFDWDKNLNKVLEEDKELAEFMGRFTK